MIRGIRLAGVLTSATALALCATASSAGAAVTIGSTFTPDLLFGGPGTFIQSSSPGNSYNVPANGVISSWSFEAPAGTTAPLKLKIVRPAGGDDFTTVGDSQLETPQPSSLNTWPTRISVKTGDLLGHFYTALDSTISYRDALGFNTRELCCSDPVLDPPPGTTATYSPNTDLQIDVSAVLEPDGDQDGFGDESQDRCLGTPGTANGCPSTVTIDQLKQKGDTKVKVTATVPGAGTLKVGSPSDPALASAAVKKSLKAVTTTLTATTKQQLKLTLKLTKSAIGKLADTGKLKLKVKAVYTPVGGPAGSQTKKKKLKS